MAGQQIVVGQQAVVAQYIAVAWETAAGTQQLLVRKQSLGSKHWLYVCSERDEPCQGSFENALKGSQLRQSQGSDAHRVQQGTADEAGNGTKAKYAPRKIHIAAVMAGSSPSTSCS